VTLKLDELIAMIEADLRHQSLERLQNQSECDRGACRVR
jgi:hypothetical protein